MSEKESVLSEIKTLMRILNTWGNALVPNLNGKETTAQERLRHFVKIATSDRGMTLEEIQAAITPQPPKEINQ